MTEWLQALDWGTLGRELMGTMTRWGLSVIGALALLLAGRLAASAVRRWLTHLLARTDTDPTILPFLSSLAYYLVLVLTVVAVLGLFGVPTASVLTVLGAAGLAIGLALQGTLSNFSAGVMLLIFRPFSVGDFIEAAGDRGTVQAVGLFNTAMDTPDNVRIVLPNATIFGNKIMNFTVNDLRRLDLTMSVSYSDDLGVAVRTIEETLAADPRVLAEPPTVIGVDTLADSSVTIIVRPWCRRQDYLPLRWTLTRNLKEQLEAAGCTIPFPQRDVHLHQELS